MYMFTIFPLLSVTVSCFKQSPLNSTYMFSPINFTVGARLLSEVLMTSLDNPFDSHDEMLSVAPIF